MPLLPDYDDAIGRVRFARVGWPKERKRVRSEDRQCDHRYHKGTVRFHAKNVLVLSAGFYGASVGFSDAAEGRIATPSSEVNTRGNSTALSPTSAKLLR
jgi:hypothetical protein